MLGSSRIQQRVSYSHQSTIDWVYDNAKERARLLDMQRRSGLEGRIASLWDTCETWILVVAIGCIVGWLAGFIDVSEVDLDNISNGYLILSTDTAKVDSTSARNFAVGI
jgi:hypothetical protein